MPQPFIRDLAGLGAAGNPYPGGRLRCGGVTTHAVGNDAGGPQGLQGPGLGVRDTGVGVGVPVGVSEELPRAEAVFEEQGLVGLEDGGWPHYLV